MAKRLFDVVCAALALIAVAPLLAAAAVLVRLASPGPILYRARRLGRGGRPFAMYKLRTMHVAAATGGGPITGTRDPRVFPLGAILRRTKIDELPQLWNVLRGDMSIVGPRPEDPEIVARYYSPGHRLTLLVRPGLASPGSLYQYTHGDALLAGGDPEGLYVARLLPVKLALDLVYVQRMGWWYDVTIIARTVGVITAIMAGRRAFRSPREMVEAEPLIRAGGERRTRMRQHDQPRIRHWAMALAPLLLALTEAGVAWC